MAQRPDEYIQLTKLEPIDFEINYCLGPWCSQGRDHREIVDRGEVSYDAEYVASAYAKTLEAVATWLNKIHDIDRATRYWEFVLYRFLYKYVEEFYLRHLYLHAALEHSESLVCVALPETAYQTPDDDAEVLCKYKKSDRFNLQLFSQAAAVAAGRCVCTEHWSREEKETEICTPDSKSSLKDRLKRRLRNFLRNTRPPTGPRSVVLFPTHLPDEKVDALRQKENYDLAESVYPRLKNPTCPADAKKRKALIPSDDADPFQRCLARSLRVNMPKDYVERFPHYHETATRLVTDGIPDAVIGGFFPGIARRIWVAECMERGSTLTFVQHGGNYGESAWAPWEDVERRLADTFVTWGWKEDDSTVPLPAPRLMKYEENDSAGSTILFVLGQTLEYPNQRDALYPGTAFDQERFIQALDGAARSQTVLRLNMRFHAKASLQADWRGRYPSLTIDRGATDMHEQMRRARLVVVDYLYATTFLECMAMNLPVVAFGHQAAAPVRPQAKPYHDALYEVGIFQGDAQEAGQLVKHIYPDVRAWWNAPERRRAVENYKKQFALTSDGDEELWSQFIESQVG